MAFIALTVRNKETFDYFLKETGACLALTVKRRPLRQLPTGTVLIVENIDYDMTDNFVLDQVDAGQEVKILRITKQANLSA